MNYTIHDAKGAIISTGSCPDGMEHIQAKDGQFMVPGCADLHNHHVVNGELMQRPQNTATISGQKISNIPPGSSIKIEGVTYPVDDGEAELDFTQPGDYVIIVQSFPHLPATFKVTI